MTFKCIGDGDFNVGDCRYVVELDDEGEIVWAGVGLWDEGFKVLGILYVTAIDGQHACLDIKDQNDRAFVKSNKWVPTHYDCVTFPVV